MPGSFRGGVKCVGARPWEQRSPSGATPSPVKLVDKSICAAPRAWVSWMWAQGVLGFAVCFIWIVGAAVCYAASRHIIVAPWTVAPARGGLPTFLFIRIAYKRRDPARALPERIMCSPEGAKIGPRGRAAPTEELIVRLSMP